jgi:hypothetical protein
MTGHADVAAARAEVDRTRAQMSDTLSEIESLIGGRVQAVQSRLNVVQLVRDNPWPALAAAVSVGVAIGATGADAKAAKAAAVAARDAGATAVNATAKAARQAPARASGAVHGATGALWRHLDTIAEALLLGIVDRLQEPATTPPPEARAG